MVELSNNELKMISGGAVSAKWGTIGVVLGVVATLISGIVDGFLRPLSCNQ